MKILLTGAEIFDSTYPETNKNQCGYGIIMRQFADLFPSKDNSVDIIMQSNFTKGRRIGKARLYRKTILNVLFHIKMFYISRAFSVMKMKDIKVKYKLHTLLYFITGAYIEDVIRKNKYDVVHVNGIGDGLIPIMYACARTDTPFFLSLHGVISFSEKTSANNFSKRMERVYFVETKDLDGAYTSIVGSGGKAKLESVIGPINNLCVIGNPLTDINSAVPTLEKAGFGEHVIICVGNITKRKNQKMVVDAFALLPEQLKEKTVLVLIGRNKDVLTDYVAEIGEKNIIFTGGLCREEVEAYYRIADVCITASIDEGFGLPLIEAYSNGVPCIIPQKIDAFEEVYEPECAVKVEEYKPELFRDAIISALEKEWDHDKIKKKAEQFSSLSCKEKYISMLEKASSEHKCIPDITVIEKIFNKCVKEEWNSSK